MIQWTSTLTSHESRTLQPFRLTKHCSSNWMPSCDTVLSPVTAINCSRRRNSWICQIQRCSVEDRSMSPTDVVRCAKFRQLESESYKWREMPGFGGTYQSVVGSRFFQPRLINGDPCVKWIPRLRNTTKVYNTNTQKRHNGLYQDQLWSDGGGGLQGHCAAPGKLSKCNDEMHALWLHTLLESWRLSIQFAQYQTTESLCIVCNIEDNILGVRLW